MLREKRKRANRQTPCRRGCGGLGLAELLLAEEGEVADTDDDLQDHADPESWVAETLADVVGHGGVVWQRACRR